MLSQEEKKEIVREVDKAERPEAACLEALKVVQKTRGWVSDEGIWEIASLLGMTPDELDAVATFYPFIFRKPVGRHIIYLCDTVSCWIMGFETMLAHLTRRLGIRIGETTADGRFTLLPASCIGACDQAPAMMIDEELHGNLTEEKIDNVLEDYK